METNKSGNSRSLDYLQAIGRRAVQNNPSCASSNIKDTPTTENFTAVGQKVVDSIDVRGKDGAEELRMQIRAARQFAIANGKS
jgi:hypothetical protein